MTLLLSMDGVKLRSGRAGRPVPVLSAETIRLRKRTAHCRCTAMVGDAFAAEAEIKFMLVDDDKM